jgi:hypothetical protein
MPLLNYAKAKWQLIKRALIALNHRGEKLRESVRELLHFIW